MADFWFDKSYSIEDEEMQKSCLKHAQRAASTGGINAFLKQAQSLVPVPLDGLNQNQWLLNCVNGTIDLQSGKLQPHRREDFISVICPKEFDPNAPSLAWDSFLESVFQDCGDVISFLQKLFGSSLVGAVYDHVLPIFWGHGANGKSTLLNAILETLGNDYSMQANQATWMTGPEALRELSMSRWTLTRKVQAGAIESGKYNSRIIVTRASVKRYLAQWGCPK
ncbi:MAG: hypothetical protein JKY95_13325 [Planctomycetaceae bacterium]|nr:hypothetical protein [Planctomycetaceae bacterium]